LELTGELTARRSEPRKQTIYDPFVLKRRMIMKEMFDGNETRIKEFQKWKGTLNKRKFVQMLKVAKLIEKAKRTN
jgi:hypothetical protein